MASNKGFIGGVGRFDNAIERFTSHTDGARNVFVANNIVEKAGKIPQISLRSVRSCKKRKRPFF